MHLAFIDLPGLAQLLEQTPPFRVLLVEDLDAAPAKALSALAAAEFDQVRYWKPKRVGEVIFNFWD